MTLRPGEHRAHGVNSPGQKPASRQPSDGCAGTCPTLTPLPPTQSTHITHQLCAHSQAAHWGQSPGGTGHQWGQDSNVAQSA